MDRSYARPFVRSSSPPFSPNRLWLFRSFSLCSFLLRDTRRSERKERGKGGNDDREERKEVAAFFSSSSFVSFVAGPTEGIDSVSRQRSGPEFDILSGEKNCSISGKPELVRCRTVFPLW